MDHYSGPATIIQRIGIRSYLVEYKDAEGKTHTFQRDAGMLSLVPPNLVQFEPEEQQMPVRPPHKHRSLTASPLWEGEVVILKMVRKLKIGIVPKSSKYFQLTLLRIIIQL